MREKFLPDKKKGGDSQRNDTESTDHSAEATVFPGNKKLIINYENIFIYRIDNIFLL